MTYRDRQRLADIQAAIDAIRSHLRRGYLSDGLVFDAVRIRLLEIDTNHLVLQATVDNDLPGFGLIAWGLGTEAPTAAEVQENFRQRIDLLRKRGPQAPATPRTETPMARRIDKFFRTVRIDLVSPVAWMVIGVPWRLRHPRRLTVLAIAMEAPNAVFHVLRAARAVQRRRPRMAAGSALVAAGSVARLRAASAEPLR